MFQRILGARVLDGSVAEVALEGRKPILELEKLFLGAGDAVADEVVLASEMRKTKFKIYWYVLSTNLT